MGFHGAGRRLVSSGDGGGGGAGGGVEGGGQKQSDSRSTKIAVGPTAEGVGRGRRPSAAARRRENRRSLVCVLRRRNGLAICGAELPALGGCARADRH